LSTQHAAERTIRLGLNVPLFVASLVAIGVGTFTGIVGIWGYAAQKLAVPEWIKVGHAHASWWAAIILLAALVVPSLPLARWFKKYLLATAFLCPAAWVVLGMYLHYGLGVEPAKYLMPVFEVPLFIALLGAALVAAGVKPPLITGAEVKPGKYEIISHVDVDRRIFLVPTLVATAGVLAGYAITTMFKAWGRPVTPAALVQLHDHPVLMSTSAVIALLALRVLNASESVLKFATRVMEVSLPLILVGLVVFCTVGVHSIVWVAPSAIYYILPVLAFLAAVGALPRAKTGELPYLSAVRAALAFTFALILVLVAVGAYISVVWDVSPNVTVTFKQPEGVQYPGPYPEKFLGTAPVKGTPRGLENAHLSPGSWAHVAALWIITLALVATTVFNEKLRKPGLLYMFLVTIPLAPTFNMLGRFLAWWPALPAGAPGGIGALWYAGHPLKGFNIISLLVLGLALLYLMRKTESYAR